MNLKTLRVLMAEGELGEKLAHLAAELERVSAERDALQGRLTAQSQDLTELTRIENRLEDQARLLDLVQEAFVVHDIEHGTISFWNPAAEELYGYRKEEALGRVADELLDTQFAVPLTGVEAQLIREGRWEGELVHRRKDGRRIVVFSRWALEYDGEGRPQAILEVNRDITEQKRATEAIAELAAIVVNARDPIVSTGLDGTITSWNHAAEALFEYRAAEVLGRPLTILYPPDRLGEFAELTKAARGEDVPPYETERVRRDGTRHDVMVSLSAIRTDGGRIIGVAATYLDISERKRMERETQHAYQLLNFHIENAPIAVVEWDQDFRVRRWSRQAQATFGWSFDEVKGRHYSDWRFVHEDDQARVDEATGRLISGAEARSVTTNRNYTRDGRIVYAEWHNSVRLDESGRLVSILSFAADVTARVELEQELVRQRDLLSRIVDHAPAGIAFVDKDLIYRWANPAHLAMIGLPAERVLSRSVRDVFGPAATAQFDQALEHLRTTGQPFVARGFPFEFEVDGVKRESFWDFTSLPVPDEHGEIQGYLMLGVEVSYRIKQAQLQAEHIRALQDGDRYKDEFLSVISHELRTPLNFIMGFASLLEDKVFGELNDRQGDALRKISSGAERMLRLVSDLLDVSRIQAGKLTVHRRPTLCAPLVEAVVAEMRPLADAKQIRLESELHALAEPLMDGPRIQQVLIILIDNAIKFTPAGGTITVRTCVQDGVWRTEVSDTGIGIPPKEISGLFQRFRQLDMSPTRSAGGVGLGLSIAKALIDAHEGEIGVESVPGQGSTFWFTVPLPATSESSAP